MRRTLAERVVRSDFLYWLGASLAPNLMIRSVLATDPAVVNSASKDERRRVREILWDVLPIRDRSSGLQNDTRLVTAPPAVSFDDIEAPTLVVSFEDDFYGTLAPARLIASKVPGARLLTYPSGGHLWVGHDAELFAEIDAFLGQS